MTRRRKFVISVFAAMLFVVVLISFEAGGCFPLWRQVWHLFSAHKHSLNSDVRFDLKMSGSGTEPDGTRFDTSQYESSDCVEVTLTYLKFSSEEAARTRFQSELASAVFSDSDGNAKPIHFNYTDAEVAVRTQRGYYEILKWQGTRLIRVESLSLNHATAFEARMMNTQNAAGTTP